MNKIALVTLVAVAGASCGTWSNEDLQYIAALPSKELLTSKVPTGNAGALSGEGTRRDALGLGEPSQLYLATKTGSEGYNKIVGLFIDLIDQVRSFPPTTRAENQRIWGPFEDKASQPGFDLQIVITKADAKNFAVQFQYRPVDTEAFTDVLVGTFTASSTAMRGQGAISWKLKEGKALGLKTDDEALKKLDKIELAYVTDVYPNQVNMAFTSIPGEPVSTFNYGYTLLETGSGRIGFRTVQTDPNATQLDVLSQYLKSGAGNGVYTVVEGNYKGATHIECWDAALKTVFVDENWPGGVKLGDAKDCATVEGFPFP